MKPIWLAEIVVMRSTCDKMISSLLAFSFSTADLLVLIMICQTKERHSHLIIFKALNMIPEIFWVFHKFKITLDTWAGIFSAQLIIRNVKRFFSKWYKCVCDEQILLMVFFSCFSGPKPEYNQNQASYLPWYTSINGAHER